VRQGGVLYVLVKRASNLPRKPFFKGRFLRRRTALHVIAAGQEKKSMSVKGDDPHFTQPLVFLLGAPPRGARAARRLVAGSGSRSGPAGGLACQDACQGGGARPTPTALTPSWMRAPPLENLAGADAHVPSLTCRVSCEHGGRTL
jgi:hypothetical protein